MARAGASAPARGRGVVTAGAAGSVDHASERKA